MAFDLPAGAVTQGMLDGLFANEAGVPYAPSGDTSSAKEMPLQYPA
jgi:hypothetical protein